MKITAEKTSEKVEVNHRIYSKSESKTLGSRGVIISDDIVVKFDNGTSGWNAQCNQEGLTYNLINAKDKKYFATVKAFGNNWLVMEKVSFHGIGSSHVTESQYATAKKVLARLMKKYDLIDMHEGNYGIDTITGKLVIFDFLARRFHTGYYNK